MEAEKILGEVWLQEERDFPAGELSHGDQRLLELGIAIAPAPELCFLDEPSSGLTPVERSRVLDLIRRLRDRDIAVVLVSHRMPDVFGVADRIVVLRRGRKVADKDISASSPEEVTGLITGAIEYA